MILASKKSYRLKANMCNADIKIAVVNGMWVSL